jgi:hypothetical protein
MAKTYAEQNESALMGFTKVDSIGVGWNGDGWSAAAYLLVIPTAAIISAA